MTEQTNAILRVAARSKTNRVAGAIAHCIRLDGTITVQAIGAAAVNQAVKSIIIAAGYLAQEQVSIVMVPGFVEVDIDGAARRALQFSITKQSYPPPATNPPFGR